MKSLAIESEIGILKRVILHTPGPEIEAMTPGEAEKDLYNDILPLSAVLKEYLQLKKFLACVAEVHELLDLLSDCLADVGNKFEFLSDLGRCFPIRSSMEELMALPARDLAEIVVRGVPSSPASLAHRLDGESYVSRPLPNTYFMRDSAAVIGDCAVSAATAFDVRMVEAVITRFIFTHHPDFAARTLLFDGPSERNRYMTVEGGDIIVLAPKVFAIGISERTTPYAVERIVRNAARISESDITVFAVDLPKTRATIHLDMVFTMIDRDAALIYEPVILGAQKSAIYRIDAGKSGKLKYREVDSLLAGLKEEGIDLEPVICGKGHRIYQQREQWLSGANSFAFAPGKILMYSCNKLTVEALADSGFAVVDSKAFIDGADSVDNYGRLAVTFDGIELARGGGGARCMTLPVERAAVVYN
ncbi:MAG: arginine deiminase family protein [Rectinemataceae bacterium]|nr:arginine deiminase family protein [Rectinemataceae bacterium]